MPALRERGRDVLTLAGSFLEENQRRLGARNLRLTPAAKSALLAHGWGGNVRELEHVLSRAALRAVNERGRDARWIAVEPRHIALQPSLVPAAPAVPAVPLVMPTADDAAEMGLREATDAFQRQWIATSLARHGGHISRAARDAGMDRSNFHRLARRLGVLTASL